MRSIRLLGWFLLLLPLICVAENDPYLLTLGSSTTNVEQVPAGYVPIAINEDAAIQAAASKSGMWIPLPDGGRVHLDYRDKILHPDGTWTFIGSVSGISGAPKSLITFGDGAAFGTVYTGLAKSFVLTTRQGQSWLVDSRRIRQPGAQPKQLMGRAFVPDHVAANVPSRPAGAVAQNEATASNPVMVDLLVVYTTDFRTSFGSTSAAIARIDYLVDAANQVLQDSQVYGRIRLVHAAEVPYTGDPKYALEDLSGINRTVPESLSSVAPMRAQYGADAVTMMQMYEPSSGSCGSYWALGQNLAPITSADAAKAYSVLEEDAALDCDPSGYGLVETLGSNFGLVPALSDNAGTGAYPFSYAYIGTIPNSGGGQFCTLLAEDLSAKLGCTHVPYLSNPNIIFSAWGVPLGVTDQADAARSLNLTLPIIAAFEPTKVVAQGDATTSDVDGDGMSDLIFQDPTDRQLDYWLMAGTPQQTISVGGVGAGYMVATTGDFNGDGKVDVVWTSSKDDLYLWTGSGSGFTSHRFGDYPAGWKVVGAGDVNGDGKDDLLFYNASQHLFGYWLMNGARVLKMQSIGPVGAGYWAAAIGDFNGDGKADIVWTSGKSDLYMWTGNGTGFTSKWFGSYPAGWQVVGVGDVDGDGKSDVLFYNPATHQFSYRIMNGTTQVRAALIGPVGAGYRVAATGDYNGDGKVDIIWTSDKDDLYMWTGSGSGFASQLIGRYPSGLQPVFTQ